MKKYFPTFGALLLYLAFSYGLDRIIFTIMTASHNDFGMYEYKARSIYWVIFAIGSFVYLWYALSNLRNDPLFSNFQVVLGIFGVFSPIFMPGNLTPNRITGFFAFLFYGAGTGALPMALTFVAGLGVVGLSKKNSEKRGNLEGEN